MRRGTLTCYLYERKVICSDGIPLTAALHSETFIHSFRVRVSVRGGTVQRTTELEGAGQWSEERASMSRLFMFHPRIHQPRGKAVFLLCFTRVFINQ